ncbi:MAG: hypothetical protein HC903_11920 [Methylacidiphilales bacterium]|nr:hypothetical protein [Candidatus Methylacidiphilales bacterium]NJR17781.1 hypothetical protein [Calothrix sp. CSU_2_0]
MYNLRQFYHSFYLLVLLLLACTNICINFITSSIANAQQVEKEKPARPRLRPSFFEEQRKLPRFGFGDFLRSALDNEQNAFSDTAKISEFGSNAYQFFRTPGQAQGTLTVGNRDTDSSDFLNGTNFVSPAGTLNFSNFVRGSDPRQGTVTVNGNVNINGRNVNFNNTRANYNAGFSTKGDDASGVVLITDPNNPTQSIYLQIPVANIGERDDSESFSAPAGLTVGFPTDR